MILKPQRSEFAYSPSSIPEARIQFIDTAIISVAPMSVWNKISPSWQSLQVSLPYDELHFGKSYIRYTYTKPLELLNESNVPAKYRIIPLTLDARLQANVTASPIEGIVEAFSILTLDIQFTAEKLGDIKLEMSISISGKDPTFLTVKITGIGIGPKLSFFSPSDGKSRSSKASTDPTTLNFGRVKVLETHTMQLEITNISLIPAVFKIFTENETSSVFHVDKSEASLEPNQVMMLQVGLHLGLSSNLNNDHRQIL